MRGTNFILKFEFQDPAKKILVAKTKLPRPIHGAKFIKVNTYQPSPVQFILTSPLVDDSNFFSNNSNNIKNGIIAIGLSGLNNEFPMVPVDPKFSVLEEVTVCIGSVVASKMEKGILEKLIKFDKMASLAEAKLFSLREKISKAIQDGKISEEEFKDINDEMQKFGLQRGTILNEGKKLSRPKNGEPKRSSSTRKLSDQLLSF